MPVVHEGNARQSPEEAAGIAARVAELLVADYTNADGEVRPLRADDVMVVAPYNAQVRCLREHLPDGVRVGTVDKFQGQEAAVVFFSMASSSGEEIPAQPRVPVQPQPAERGDLARTLPGGTCL